MTSNEWKLASILKNLSLQIEKDYPIYNVNILERRIWSWEWARFCEKPGVDFKNGVWGG